MPKTSDRAKLLNEIKEVLFLLILLDEIETIEFENFVYLSVLISSRRNLNDSVHIPKTQIMNQLLFLWPDDSFRQEVRMDKQSFQALVNMIQVHLVFRNQSVYPQKPIWLQLIVNSNIEKIGELWQC